MIYAAKNANVDVINMSIGGLPALNDANNTERSSTTGSSSSTTSRCSSRPATAAGVNTIGDPSVATKVMSVGCLHHRRDVESNYGSKRTGGGTDNLHPFSSRGPRTDGASSRTSSPRCRDLPTPLWQAGGPVPGVHAAIRLLDAQWNVDGLTAGAGAAARSWSCAEQSGVQHQPAQLRTALNSSARFLGNYGAHEQGNGLIDGRRCLGLASNAIKPWTSRRRSRRHVAGAVLRHARQGRRHP